MNWYKTAQEDYRGEHEAPDRESGSPLYNLKDIYPEDIYSHEGARYYGHYGQNHPLDVYCVSIIQRARNKPNLPLTVYRAVPSINGKVDAQIKELNRIIWYFDTYRFFPLDNSIIKQMGKKYPSEQYTGHQYNERQLLIYQDILSQIKQLESQKQKPITINKGDWVTITKEYAKEHGESLLKGNYKILSKNVRAKDLFTSGDSIQEWGYDPS
jgi:hypothetical protein